MGKTCFSTKCKEFLVANKIIHVRAAHLLKPVKPEDTPALLVRADAEIKLFPTVFLFG